MQEIINNTNNNTASLPDVQKNADHRNLPIQKVGIKDVRYPLSIIIDDPKKGKKSVQTVAKISMYVGLTAEVKGTHMSRFLELLEAWEQPVTIAELRHFFTKMLEKLEANTGQMIIECPFFIQKEAPVSKVTSLLDYEATWVIEKTAEQSMINVYQQVLVPVKSLCPCSKKVSIYGAHNQRSHIIIKGLVQHDVSHISLYEMVRYAENAASCEIYGLLKRPDEKYVTEHAYENPKFVEDLVRDVALSVKQDKRFISGCVSSENFESIHNHSAFAQIEFVVN
jgi:GTP cyclohydrolase FolE2